MSTDHDRQSDLAVMDAQEYKQKRRLERILDAHDKVEEKIDEAEELFATGEVGVKGRNVMLLQAVQQFIREVYNLLDPDDHADYWAGTALGTLQMETGRHEFHGLRDILYADTFYSETITQKVATPCGPDRTEEYSESYAVPKHVSENAYLLTKEFLSEEHDLEIQFEELDDSLPMFGYEVVDEDIDANGDATNGHTV